MLRDVDPAVWTAAYGPAFVHEYAMAHSACDEPDPTLRRVEALRRVNVVACIEVADAAVAALTR